MKRAAALLLTFFLLLGVVPPGFAAPEDPAPPEETEAFAVGYYRLTAKTALKETPEAEEPLITLPKGAVLKVTEARENYGRVNWDGAEGWADLNGGAYLSPLADKNGEIGLIIDVSRFNPPESLDWEKLKAAGVTGAILRVGGRFVRSKEIYDDTAFFTHCGNACAAGLDVGAYFFSFAMTEEQAKEEANYALDVLKAAGCEVRLPVFIDIEGYNGDTQHLKLGKAGCSAVTAAFCDTVLDAGYCPGICTYTNFAEALLDESVFTPERAVWMADYRAGGCGYGGHVDLWQFTGSGRLPGAANEIDLSLCYTDFPALIAAYGSGCEAGNHRPHTDWEVTDPGICTGEGTRVKTCIDCGAVLEIGTMPGTRHDWELVNSTPSTCAEAGEETYVCRNDPTHVKTEPAPLAEHTYGAWIELRAPGFTEPGLRARVCSVCAAVETEELPPVPVPDYVPGDMDGDGLVRAADARLVLRAAVKLETFRATDAAFLAADTDGDGKITAADARTVLRAAVGLETLIKA